jgi:hypothetical protein
LRTGAVAARLVADELDKAAERLTRALGIAEPTIKRIMSKYGALSPEQKRIVSEEVDRLLAKQSTEEPAPDSRADVHARAFRDLEPGWPATPGG